jgi:hypothetical protein
MRGLPPVGVLPQDRRAQTRWEAGMKVVLWTLGGFLLGGALAFGIGLLWLTYGGVSQREGAAAMGVIFFFTPAGSILGAIVGLMMGLVRRRR